MTSPAPDSDGDLRDYAPIGDGRTVALVGLRGQIDWLPVPHLDSVPVFAGLLDPHTGGRVELEPDEEYTVQRRYIPRTNVLQTTFGTASGRARITDALVTGVAGRLPWAELARRVEGLDGTVRFRWRVQPGTRLGTAAPWIEDRDGSFLLRVGDVSLAVAGDGHGEAEADREDAAGPAVHGAFTASAGSRHLLIVVGTDGEPLHLPDPGNVDRGIDRTIEAWRAWSREFSYEGPWARAVQRSALALKLLVYAPTGAIAAAATTSLPESPRGGKNWDYRFA
jgi:GH15 family glucan-1,4-alpha-glucosidase